MNLQILPFTVEDIAALLTWNEDKGEDFLQQWAGNGYDYPLTHEQILEKINKSERPGAECQVYKIILAEMEFTMAERSNMKARVIGAVELNTARMPRRSAMVCRFLLDPAYQSKGYGSCALMLLTKMAFRKLGYKMLRLKVFAFNKQAIRCYEKAGFVPCGLAEWPNGCKVVEMEIRKRLW
ncbi:MAG: GNAT family N-acetyltransferase [Clostridiales bacterium]|jgi:RimJ/RimL family protein N-acetyltransferase|nr:GNAT family N-acetyltransferase [Clostridiales bacterium]